MLTQARELDSESELHSPITEREIFGCPPSRKGALLILAPSRRWLAHEFPKNFPPSADVG